MKSQWVRSIALASLLLSFGIHAKELEPKNVEKEFKSLMSPKESLGVWIGSSQAPWWHHAGEQLLIPASVTKLITGAALLHELGPTWTFKNQLCVAKASELKVAGKEALVFKAVGDPSFVSESLWAIVNQAKQRGLSRLEGPVVVDVSLFDEVYFDESRLSKRVSRAYDAPVSSASFNWNSVNVRVKVSEKPSRVEVSIDPFSDFFSIKNQVKLGNKDELWAEVTEENEKTQKISLVVSGILRAKTGEKTIYAPVKNPPLWLGLNLKAMLAQQGVVVQGPVVAKNLASNLACETLAEWDSRPLWHMVQDMNKFSNNFVAEMLVKSLSARYQQPASLAHGMHLIRQWLKNFGFQETRDFILVNPSGLTRDNLMTVKFFIRLLESIQGNIKYGPEFLSSLPLAGVDGTLKRRMSGIQGQVRAKTGYLSGVVSLVGYFQKKSHTEYIPFAFIYNGPQEEKAKDVFDRVLEKLVEE